MSLLFLRDKIKCYEDSEDFYQLLELLGSQPQTPEYSFKFTTRDQYISPNAEASGESSPWTSTRALNTFQRNLIPNHLYFVALYSQGENQKYLKTLQLPGTLPTGIRL